MATITRTIGKLWNRICIASEIANHLDNQIHYRIELRNGFPAWNKVN